MKIITLAVVCALPALALGQTEPQQNQGQTQETQATAPAKKKKERPAQEPGKAQAPQTGVQDMHGKAKAPTQDVNKTQPNGRSSTSQTNVNQSTKVNVQEFKSRHTEVFSLGRHPKEFFVHRFGAKHFRLIGNAYFAFVDGCWVSVDVDGFVYTERVICAGDPDFIVID